MPIQLEICANSIESVKAAVSGGASRIELCSGLSEGGLTPSQGLIREALRICPVPCHVLIRPRGGDFLYNSDELAVMLDDICLCRALGVQGVVVGALTPDGSIDKPLLRQMVQAAGGMSVTFHRAFDLCRDPLCALEDIISAGCSRLLTSGCSASALSGVALLRDLVTAAGARLSIMAGCGITPSNVKAVVQQSGVREVHASAKAALASRMQFARHDVAMGHTADDAYTSYETSAAIVRRFADALCSTD